MFEFIPQKTCVDYLLLPDLKSLRHNIIKACQTEHQHFQPWVLGLRPSSLLLSYGTIFYLFLSPCSCYFLTGPDPITFSQNPPQLLFGLNFYDPIYGPANLLNRILNSRIIWRGSVALFCSVNLLVYMIWSWPSILWKKNLLKANNFAHIEAWNQQFASYCMLTIFSCA